MNQKPKKIKIEDIALTKFGYMLNQDVRYKEIFIPKGFIFDGVTLKFPYSFFFSSKDIYKGIRAALVHDYMCKNKNIYNRKRATDILIEMWLEDELPLWKALFIKPAVNLYQFLKGWK